MAVTRTTTISSQTIVSSPAIKVSGTITVSRATKNTKEVTSSASLTFTMGSSSYTGYRYDVEMSFSNVGLSSTKKLNSLGTTWSSGTSKSASPSITTGSNWTTGSRTMHIDVYKNESSDSKGTTLVGSIDVDLNMPTYEAPATTYTVTYNAGGGTVSPSSEVVNQGSAVTLPTPTRQDYDFTGWYNGSTYVGFAGSLYTPSGSVTLTAHWEESQPEEYTVYYDANGGSVSPSSQTVEEGQAVLLPYPTRDAHIFKGWYSGSTKIGDEGASYIPSSDTILTAHWDVAFYYVFYDANGGDTTPRTMMKQPNETIQVADGITKANTVSQITTTYNSEGGSPVPDAISNKEQSHLFYSWKSSYSQWQYDAGADFEENADVTLVAQWEDSTAYYEEIILGFTERAGYYFLGWYDGETRIGSALDTYRPQESKTLSAHWEAINYTITFNANGGTVSPETTTVIADAEVGQLPTPTRTGFEFLGWFTQQTGGTQIDEHTKPLASVTYYAHWEAATSISFSTGLGEYVTKRSLVYVNTEQGWKMAMTYIATEDGWKRTS